MHVDKSSATFVLLLLGAVFIPTAAKTENYFKRRRGLLLRVGCPGRPRVIPIDGYYHCVSILLWGAHIVVPINLSDNFAQCALLVEQFFNLYRWPDGS